VHPTQITDWKPHVLARAVDVFGGTKSTSDVPDLKVLHAKIGQLTLENDCSEGAAHQGGLAERKAMINRTHALPIARPCQLLALSCSTVYYHTRLCRQRTWRWCVGVTSSIWSICLPSHAC
jgi:putative transposase